MTRMPIPPKASISTSPTTPTGSRSLKRIHPMPSATAPRSRLGAAGRLGAIRAISPTSATNALRNAPAADGPLGLDLLHDRLLAAALRRNATPSLVPVIRQAAQESAAIAWLQPFPLLAFPGLFEEKLHAARRRHHRQNVIRSRSEEWLELAS